MANAEVFKVEINPEYIVQRMHDEKIGYRTLAKRIGISSDRSLRYYLQEGAMPPYILNLVCRELKLEAARALKGKSIWMRIGVTVPVTDEELKEIINGGTNEETDRLYYCDYDFQDDRSVEFLRRAIADGDSYVPGDVIMKCDMKDA